MLKINNKGQILVLFVILIPIFILILTLIYDIGNAIYEKNSLSNTNYMAIDYGLSNINDISENDLIDIILKNNNDLDDIVVNISDNEIYVKTTKKINGVIGRMFGLDIIDVVSEYDGKIYNDKKKIERIK